MVGKVRAKRGFWFPLAITGKVRGHSANTRSVQNMQWQLTTRVFATIWILMLFERRSLKNFRLASSTQGTPQNHHLYLSVQRTGSCLFRWCTKITNRGVSLINLQYIYILITCYFTHIHWIYSIYFSFICIYLIHLFNSVYIYVWWAFVCMTLHGPSTSWCKIKWTMTIKVEFCFEESLGCTQRLIFSFRIGLHRIAQQNLLHCPVKAMGPWDSYTVLVLPFPELSAGNVSKRARFSTIRSLQRIHINFRWVKIWYRENNFCTHLGNQIS